MPEIKAIETVYKGYRFRSRLEARWAVFFDALGVEWEYEPEGYVLLDGTYYLPDFKLQKIGVYAGPGEDGRLLFIDNLPPFFIEIKPSVDRFVEAYGRLVLNFTKPLIFLLFDPYSCAVSFMGESSEQGRVVAPSGWVDNGQGIGLLLPPRFVSVGKLVRDSPVVAKGYYNQKIWDAKTAARQARFEHGENGACR